MLEHGTGAKLPTTSKLHRLASIVISLNAIPAARKLPTGNLPSSKVTECPWCARPRAIPINLKVGKSCPRSSSPAALPESASPPRSATAREGWTVGVYDYDDKALAAVKKDHPEFITGHLDVRKADEWTKALADFVAHRRQARRARQQRRHPSLPVAWMRSHPRRSPARSISTSPV